jgi:hypothetical protein
MLAYFGPRLLQESSVEQTRVWASPFKKRRGKKKIRKKRNGQRNKLHVHLVKPETIICTQHILGINELLVLLMSFIYGCLAKESHGRLYVYLGPRLQEAVEFDLDRRWSLTQRKYCSVLTKKTLLNRVEADCLIHTKWDGWSLRSWTRMDGPGQKNWGEKFCLFKTDVARPAWARILEISSTVFQLNTNKAHNK